MATAYEELKLCVGYRRYRPLCSRRMVYFFAPWMKLAKDFAKSEGVSIGFGFCFGAAYVRFQDITWQLVPEGSEWANVMGFNVMCRRHKGHHLNSLRV